jgi:predicted tellurium resistance membrane protein TerC
MNLEIFTHPDTLVSLLTLTAMEIVLGIDNIVFISILTGRLPPAQQPLARRLGLGLALVMRLGLLFAISWVMSLTNPLFSVMGRDFSGRHLILLGGGLFLIGKATHEIHTKLEGAADESPKASSASAFGLILLQIMILDLVFSLDSVITAVGMVDEISVMVVAMVIAVGVMLTFAGAVGNFVHRHPTMKILALSFLLLIGVMLVAESIGQHIAKGTIYFAMAFSLGVEIMNLRLRKRSAPVTLHEPVDPNSTKPH